jgi:hypothetical protein
MNIFMWIFIWYGTFAGCHLFFKRKNILYMNNPLMIVGWYAIMTIAAALLFYSKFDWVFSSGTVPVIIAGAILVVVSTLVFYWLLTRRAFIEWRVSRNIFQGKMMEIIFQQVMIWALVGIIKDQQIATNFILVFALVFCVIHIPLMAVISWKKALCFVVASLVGGAAFAACSIFIPAGWLFVAALHIGFYAAIASQRTIFGMSSFHSM